jgi:hypothetical protein
MSKALLDRGHLRKYRKVMSTLDMADHGVRSIIGRENKKYKNA